jgi:hypothetical protein
VDHAHRRVAVGGFVDEDPQAQQVVDVGELTTSYDHLLVDRVVVLRPPVHGRGDLRRREIGRDLGDDLREVALAPRLVVRDEVDDLVVHLGLHRREREVLELPLDRVHAEPVGQRRVDVEGLASDAVLLVGTQRAERTHVVEPVGELDDQDADVAAHRDDHLADRLRLGVLPELDLVQLRDAVDHRGDLRAELGGELLHRVRRVLHGVVEQRRAQGGLGHAELGEDRRDRQRVRDVRVAGLAGLAGVVVLRRPVGTLDDGEVGLGVVLPDDVEEGFEDGVLWLPRGCPASDPLSHPESRLLRSGIGPGQGRRQRSDFRCRFRVRDDVCARDALLGHAPPYRVVSPSLGAQRQR